MNVPIFSGHERFCFNETPLPFSIQEFWAWNCSDLLNNTLRGALAEFIVAKALGITFDTAREDWTPYDLLYPFKGRNFSIEIKSSAYLQSWEQNKLSNIRFDIAPSRAWVNQTHVDPIKRHSDIYVFCLYAFRDMENKNNAKPMQLEQWKFFVIETSKIDESFGMQRSVSPSVLLKLSPVQCSFMNLKESIEQNLRKITPPLA